MLVKLELNLKCGLNLGYAKNSSLNYNYDLLIVFGTINYIFGTINYNLTAASFCKSLAKL